MSASERLRALDEAMTPGPWYYIGSEEITDAGGKFVRARSSEGEQIVVLRNALPLIAGVVEATERSAHLDDAEFLMGIDHLTPCIQCSALTALRDALGGNDE